MLKAGFKELANEKGIVSTFEILSAELIQPCVRF